MWVSMSDRVESPRGARPTRVRAAVAAVAVVTAGTGYLVLSAPTSAPALCQDRPSPGARTHHQKTPGARTGATGASAPEPFRVASFNVLGNVHTEPGTRSGWRTGVVRVRMGLRHLNALHIDLVGLQEFEPKQAVAFRAAAGAQWATWSGSRDTGNSVAWRTRTFEFVSGHTFPIRYFAGTVRHVPVVLLRLKATGQEMWIVNVHNPASISKFGDQSHWRQVDVISERKLLTHLAGTGTPVLFTGDMNDTAAFYYPVTANRVLHAAADVASGDGHCVVFPGIDWVLGSKTVRFSGWTVDRSVTGTVTDHPIVYADATLGDRRRPGR